MLWLLSKISNYTAKWKKNAGGSPAKVDKFLSTKVPRTCDMKTMTEDVTSGADTYVYGASSAGYAEWCE